MHQGSLNLIEIKYDLKKRLSKYRFKHTIGVAKTAVSIAKKIGIDLQKAELAGLLHDYAKCIDEKKLLEIVNRSDWEIGSIELNLPAVLHAPAGAFLVQNKYGIIDKDILEAIRFHTIGDPEMGKLALIIFVADFIEPNRNYSGVDKLRKIPKKHLDKLIVSVCNKSIEYNIGKNRIIHPNTLLLRNKYLGGKF